LAQWWEAPLRRWWVVRLTLIVGGLTAASTGAVLLIPGVTEPDLRHLEAR
jgi:hypothetical protein